MPQVYKFSASLPSRLCYYGVKSLKNNCQTSGRLIKTISATADDEEATMSNSLIDWNKVTAEERFDGFYAYGTSLEDHSMDIRKANSFRSEIETLFRVTKTDLDLRPIYLSRKNRILGHFIVCFIALLIIKQLQKTLGNICSVEQLCKTLRSIKLLYHDLYIVGYSRQDGLQY